MRGARVRRRGSCHRLGDRGLAGVGAIDRGAHPAVEEPSDESQRDQQRNNSKGRRRAPRGTGEVAGIATLAGLWIGI